MASSNVIAEVRKLALAATKSKSHPLHEAVMAPSKWAREAGFQGSAASPLRDHMARKSSNGVGRTGRYAVQDAQGMLDVLDEADAFVKADGQAKQDAARKRVRRALDKHRARVATTRKAKEAASTKREAKTTAE